MNKFQRLKDVREDNNLTQSDIAKILNTTQQQICRYETGLQMMGIDKYIILAKYYNLSLDYLTGVVDTPRDLHSENINLSDNQKKLINAYNENPEVRFVIDKLLNSL